MSDRACFASVYLSRELRRMDPRLIFRLARTCEPCDAAARVVVVAARRLRLSPEDTIAASRVPLAETLARIGSAPAPSAVREATARLRRIVLA